MPGPHHSPQLNQGAAFVELHHAIADLRAEVTRVGDLLTLSTPDFFTPEELRARLHLRRTTIMQILKDMGLASGLKGKRVRISLADAREVKRRAGSM